MNWQFSIDAETWKDIDLPTTLAAAIGWTYDSPSKLEVMHSWWRTTIPRAGTLVLEGLATLCQVLLDGKVILETDNMFVEHRVAVTPGELVLHFVPIDLAQKRPRPRWRVPMIEQQHLRWFRTTLLGRTPGWSPPCPPSGPWRPIYLLEDEKPAITARDGVIEVRGGGSSVVVTRGEKTWTAPLVDGVARVMTDHQLWWPHTHGEPALYDVAIDGRAVGKTGFRTVEVDRTGGDFAVLVNGVRVFCRGACWTPLDAISLQATPAQYREAVQQLVDAGMNMVRVGGTMVYEHTALYEALDEAGVLLWHDFMFANMDYPDELDVSVEIDQQVARLQRHPCVAVLCGNSEGEQQAAMSGAGRERWAPALFHIELPKRVASLGVPYVPSSTHGGAFPHQPNTGCTSYYGVGAYQRPLEDARRAEVRFASECLAFANLGKMPDGQRVHHPAWKLRTPRDLGAGWDFDDIRDHYVQRLYGVDPNALRYADHDRYVQLGRLATGEVMAATFGEWRRARSITRGGLIWFLRDLWPGAGWGVVEHGGRPKPAWYALRRALAPRALAITDEGNNGVAIHAANDRAEAWSETLHLSLFRGSARVGGGSLDVVVPARGAIEVNAVQLLEGFSDLSYAYRFGPPGATTIHARLGDREAFHFPAGAPIAHTAVGLEATRDGDSLTISSTGLAYGISIDLPGYLPEDDAFHLAPGQTRTILLRRIGATKSGNVTCVNSDTGVRVEVPRGA